VPCTGTHGHTPGRRRAFPALHAEIRDDQPKSPDAERRRTRPSVTRLLFSDEQAKAHPLLAA
jgi:hypothetical protein